MNPTVASPHRWPQLAVSLLVLNLLLPVTLLRAQTASSNVIELDKFTVTADIDSYFQSTSSMATKLPMEMRQIPSSLSILNSTAIRDRNTVSLSDVFAYVTGAAQSQNNVNGFSFRGFPNTGSYTQNIQFDGLQGATLQKSGTTAANVDSLEFLKGPNGVLYGQMNPGGLLNIVTKSPKEVRETDVRLTVGSYNGEFSSLGDTVTKTITVDTTGPVLRSKHLFYRLVVDSSANPNSRPGNFANGVSVYPSLTYKWSNDTAFTLKGEVSKYTRRQDDGMVPIFTNGTAFGVNARWITAPHNTIYQDTKDRGIDYGDALSLFFKTTLPFDWQLRVVGRSVWHIDQVRELTVNNANVYNPSIATARYAQPTSTLRRQYNNVRNGHRYNYLDANAYRSFGPEKFKHTVIIGTGGGAEAFHNKRISFGPNQTVAQAISLYNPVLDLYDYPAEGTGATDQVTYQQSFGQYVSDQIKVGTRLHVSLGARRDEQSVNGMNKLTAATSAFATSTSGTTKQGGVVFDVTPTLAVYGSWSQSFKPAVNIAYDVTGNSNFPPETGEQFEGGLKFETADKKFNLTIATYQIKRQNVLVASGTNFTAATLPPGSSATVGQAISRLDGEQKSTGYEVEGRWQPVPNWQVQAGYAHSKAIINASITNPASVGLDLANAPRDTANFWTRYNLPRGGLKGLGFGLGYIYVGDAWAGDPTTTVYYQLPAWSRVDGSVYYKSKRLDYALNIQNLFDKRYIGSAQSALTLNQGEQRKLTLSVSTKF